jgi:hypothetical protein
MRGYVAALAFAASILVPEFSLAAVPPPNVLFAGTIARRFISNGGPVCLFEGTNSTYIRRGTLTLISFPDIVVAPTGSVGPAFTVGGQAKLTFTTATNGRVEFIPVPGNGTINRPSFTNYAADYDSATHIVTVSLRIHFGTCVLPVTGTYRN